jgi:hypothetical protein
VEMSETHRSRPILLRYSWRFCGSPCHNPFSLAIRLCLCLFFIFFLMMRRAQAQKNRTTRRLI